MKYWNKILYILVLFLLASCSSDAVDIASEKDIHFTCGAEKIVGNKLVASNGVLLSGESARTTERARTGKYSLKLSAKNSYGFSYTLLNVKKGQVIATSAWKSLDTHSGALVIAPTGTKEGYTSSGHVKEVNGEWGKMDVMFIAQRDYDTVLVYAYSFDEKPIYVDDFVVDVYVGTKKPKVNNKSKALYITIPKSAQDSLNNFKKIALEQEIISSDLKQYVRAFVDVNSEKAPVELRIKGDWTDHVETDKVSYRIKMGDDHAYKGLKTFSIQNPYTRSFLMEWFAHKLYENEDILTTQYELVPVFINGKNAGVYALEEHFDKQLLESRHRREGPIMKFDESGVWQVHKNLKKTGDYVAAPAYESAEISVFKKNRTKKNPALFGQFKVAQTKMELYRQRGQDVGEYFDVEALAKYLALTELINGKHGLTWHNQRLYFNPITQRLEPIAYDCFMEANKLLRDHELLGLLKSEDTDYGVLRATLTDNRVKDRYIFYLEKFSNPKYLDQVFKKFKIEIETAERLIQYEYPNVKLDKGYFRFNTIEIKRQLSTLKSTQVQQTDDHVIYGALPENFIYTDIALKANVESFNADGSVYVSMRNYHSHELEVIGYSVKRNKDSLIPIPKVKLSKYGSNQVKTVTFPEKPRRIHYKTANCGDKVFKCNPEEWPMPRVDSEPNSSHVNAEPVNGVVTLRGHLSFGQDLIIPECNKLVIEAGTIIDLKNSAALISYAPVHSKGTKSNPVLIKSSDHSGNGFIVLSPKKSTMQYTNFDHLNTMNKNGWVLTGAVTFYGAEVVLNNCSFKNNHCEDALNTIRCNVSIKNCLVDNTYSDGYDADFCTGIVSSSTFSNTGNDCIDFSGSKILITGCTIINSGDKGVSGGEDSELTVENCIVKGASIAVASKDKSKVTVRNLSIEKANVAFSAYRKKPEYGPAILIVESMGKNNAKELHLLEKGSKLNYLTKTYVGKKKFDIDSMYAQFDK